jgi:hypothetical protein
MKRWYKKSSGVYTYLDASGLLENGSGEAIEQAKKQYWNNYKKRWKKEKQKTTKMVEVVFSMSEFRIITREAERHHTNPTSYIKRSALANSRVIADPAFIGEFREQLIMHHNSLQALAENNIMPLQVSCRLLEQMAGIEEKALKLFSSLKQNR